jgi:hypothetical protein
VELNLYSQWRGQRIYIFLLQYWNVFDVTFLVSRIFRRILEFWIIFAPCNMSFICQILYFLSPDEQINVTSSEKQQIPFLFQITETYAFLPREAVTRFLLGCTDCQRRPRSPSPITAANALKSTPNPSLAHIPPDSEQPPHIPSADSDNFSLPSPITMKSSPNTANSRRLNNHHHLNNNHHNNHHQRATSTPMTLKPSANHQRLNNNHHIHNNNHLKKLVEPPDIDFSLPITTTYLKHMRSLGYTDEDALKIDVEVSPSPHD